ncbi:MAG: type II toxin-antitoxin system HicA family toxin [Candidatus Kapabacteria bacterium]|nr:type II toxin-antitoxin system HicA family toxin [Candidatus Kapabacteria bacterium]
MKRKELIKWLILNGCILEREGSKHTVFYNPESNQSSTVPRHIEINTFTARGICESLKIPVIKMK